MFRLYLSRLLLQVAWAACQNVVNITPNVSVRDARGSLSQIVSPAYVGFGIEASNLVSFTGAETPNQLSLNLLQTLANYTGVPPHLRIGGNTQDNMVYMANYNGYFPATNTRPQGKGQVPWDLYIFGPKYFEALDRFPPGTPITYGLGLSYDFANWTDQITATADAARARLNRTRLASFEIGNEPNLYFQNGFRNDSWSGQVYAQQWLSRADTIYQQVLKPHSLSRVFFEPTCTSSTIQNSFEITQLAYQDGILAHANDSTNATTPYISAWNQHDYFYYKNISNYSLTLYQLMDLSSLPDQFTAWATQVQQAFNTGYPYVLREFASVGPRGETGLSDVFGATLWTFNALLYFATLNISSVHFHMTDDSYAAPWQPVDHANSPAHVMSTYYAFAAMTQLIGPGCTTRIQSVPVTNTPSRYENRLGAYATYQHGSLAAMVLLNTMLVNSSEPKGFISWSVTLPELAGQTVFLSYLTSSGADAASNTTWNSISYEQSDDGTPTGTNSTIITTSVGFDGTLSLSLRDSEAVVANIGHQIGTGPSAQYNETACQVLASSRPDSTYDALNDGGSPTQSSSSTNIYQLNGARVNAPTLHGVLLMSMLTALSVAVGGAKAQAFNVIRI